MGAKVVWHAKYVTIQMAGVAVPRELFAAILERIQRFGVPPPLPEMRTGRAMSQDRAILAAKAKNLPAQAEEGGRGPYTSAVRAVLVTSKLVFVRRALSRLRGRSLRGQDCGR